MDRVAVIQIARSIQKFQGRKYIVDSASEPHLQALGIHDGMDWVDYAGGVLVQDSPTTRCRRVVSGDGTAFYFKRYICSFRRGIQFWMRPGKAAVEVWAYQKLAALGIPTLKVVAYGEDRVLGVLRSACVVTREIPDSQNLEDFALNHWYQMPEPKRNQVCDEISVQLAEQTRQAHQGGFFHHDLKWRNVLIQQLDGHYRAVWIDAPRAWTMPFRKRRGVVVDLAGLARLAVSLLSLNARMRFIWNYLGPERRPGDAAKLYREVARNLGRRPPKPIKLPPRTMV